LEKEVEKDGVCYSPLFNLYSEYLSEYVLEGFGDLSIRGQVILTVKYASDLMLLAKE
jgi:hypothetical protein